MKNVSVYDLPYNPFQEISKNWFLIAAKKKDGTVNAMTAGWGGLGMIWGKETITVYIRQSRYTKEFVDEADTFTVSLFDGYKKELGTMGRISGRDCDKIKEAGLTLTDIDGAPAFAESKCTFVCSKIYQDDIPMDAMPDWAVDAWYGDGDYHTMYIGRIEGCYLAD